MNLRHLLTGLLIAVAITAGAKAATSQLYADSTLIVQDRFSDEIIGKGPDLVFIPGLSSSRATFKAVADTLKSRYRLHLIQVAGFAGEPARANATGAVLEPTAEAIDAYLVAQKLAPATVIGHSLGGTMSLYLVQKHPEHFKKVMLVDALPFYAVLMGGPAATTDSVKPIADALRANTQPMPEAQRNAMLAMMATSASDKATITEWGKASEPATVKNAMADDITLDLRPGLAAITTPITLVYPDYAAMGRGPGQAKGLYASQYAPLKTIQFVEIEKALHFVMLDQPTQFAAAVDAFLKN